MEEGFKKIDFDSRDQIREEETGRLSPRKIPRKKILIILGILGVLGLIGFFAVLLPLQRTYSLAKETAENARETVKAVKDQDIQKADEKIKITQEKLAETKKSSKVLVWVKFIPFLGGYYNDSQHLLQAGTYGLEAAEILVEAVKPYADILGLKGQGSFVLGSAEERIQKTVQTMDKLTPKLSEINQKMVLIREEVDKINPNRYPTSLGGKKIKPQIVSLKNTVDTAQKTLSEAQPLLEILPQLLGEPQPKKYLILFQNDKELRPSGGFITAYAVFRVEHGKLITEAADDIYKLDQRRTQRVPAPDPVKKYLPREGGGVTTEWQMRDSNLSPDFKVSMEDFVKFYKQVPGAPQVDGIVAIDTEVLLRTIDILGGVTAYGANFTTEKVAACNCPQVIYELERYADQPVAYERGSRKDIIGVLMYNIMQKALGVSPRLYWGRLFQEGLNLIAEKHTLIYLFEEKAQKGVETFNLAGRIKDFDGDYLHINDTNFAGAKANMYVKHEVTQKIEITGDGSVIKTLVLNYKNPQPPDNCSLERTAGLCLSAPLRNWVRIYVPKGSQLLESKGSEIEVQTSEDLDKTVFEGFLTVRPLGSAQMMVKYKLPQRVEKGKDYLLLIQKQPGTLGHDYVIQINGKEVEKFPLKTDRELKIRV